MKTRFILIILCSFLLSAVAHLTNSSPVFSLNRKSASTSPISFFGTTLYGPFDGGESVKFEWNYRNDSKTAYDSVIDYFIVNCPAYSSIPLISKNVASHALNPGKSYRASFRYTIPKDRLYSSSGLVIKVGVMHQNSYIALLEKKIKLIDRRTINPLNYRVRPYEIKYSSFYFREEDVVESFLFDEYNDYVECDEYNRLLFNKLSFFYHYPHSLVYKSIAIKFIDKNGLFPNLTKDEDGYTIVNADLVNKDSRYSLAIKNLWYDPVTLFTNTSGEGNKTDYLYVPKGRGSQVKDYEFTIVANSLGINKTNFSHSLEVDVSPYFIGDCDSADYCVIGGVKK